MNGGRGLIIVLAALFFGWLSWLSLAVWQKDQTQVLSRAQLAAATHIVVADITTDSEGNPAQVAVTQVIKGPPVTGQIDVMNLSGATPPGLSPFPGNGPYLLALVGDGKTFRIAGLPRSPGIEPQSQVRPTIYRWDGPTMKQLEGLGLHKGS